jgi:protein-serine/threonine kinase
LIDKDGHLKFSDFGLSTGFHKTHDSSYYQRLLGGEPKHTDPLAKAGVEKVNLTLSRKDRLATWKKNRRTLVRSYLSLASFMVGLFDRGNTGLYRPRSLYADGIWA